MVRLFLKHALTAAHKPGSSLVIPNRASAAGFVAGHRPLCGAWLPEHNAAHSVEGTRIVSIEITTFRLYLMRATYLLMLVGLAINVWPGVIHHAKPVELMDGIVASMLATVSVLAAIGIRYPLQMLPLLLFELIWKSIWLMAYALPLWSANQMDTGTDATVFACLMGMVIFPIAIPWPYVLANYFRRPGDRWGRVARKTGFASVNQPEVS